MGIHVFISDDGSSSGTGPILFLAELPSKILPRHPRSLGWRYVATIAEDDSLLESDGPEVQQALNTDGFFIADRLLNE